tara:strand:+ start:538 stop:738 length:201 start_codon:yes stop_codon:yes gene_type:complete
MKLALIKITAILKAIITYSARLMYRIIKKLMKLIIKLVVDNIAIIEFYSALALLIFVVITLTVFSI